MKTDLLCLHQLFQSQACRTSEAVAEVDGDKTMTYSLHSERRSQ